MESSSEAPIEVEAEDTQIHSIEQEYPSGFKFIAIIVALVLSIFLVGPFIPYIRRRKMK
jgi:hypothetical protein